VDAVWLEQGRQSSEVVFYLLSKGRGERMWWSAVVYQLKHRLLTTRKAGVWLSIGPSTLNGNKICTATVLATIFYVTFCLGASCLRLDLHCILTAVQQTPNNPAPMTQIILHQPHRTPKKTPPSNFCLSSHLLSAQIRGNVYRATPHALITKA